MEPGTGQAGRLGGGTAAAHRAATGKSMPRAPAMLAMLATLTMLTMPAMVEGDHLGHGMLFITTTSIRSVIVWAPEVMPACEPFADRLPPAAATPAPPIAVLVVCLVVRRAGPAASVGVHGAEMLIAETMQSAVSCAAAGAGRQWVTSRDSLPSRLPLGEAAEVRGRFPWNPSPKGRQEGREPRGKRPHGGPCSPSLG